MTKRQGDRMWQEAGIKANKLIEMMEDEGKFPEAADVPFTDEAKAKSALKELAEVALSKGTPVKVRISALKILLEFTKEKPAQRSKVTLDKSEEWLMALEADMQKDPK
jgi:hypothetical protein